MIVLQNHSSGHSSLFLGQETRHMGKRHQELSALERRITRIEELVRGYRDALEVDPEAVARRVDNFDSLM